MTLFFTRNEVALMMKRNTPIPLVFLAAATLLLVSCTTKAPPPEIDVPIVQGWLPSYDSLIKSEVTQEMLAVSPTRIKDFCPNWNKLDQGQKEDFYADFVQAVAWTESGYDSASMYVEDKLGKDPVTGQNVVSEGLMQLSYQDKLQYGKACDFNFSKDREAFLEDLEAHNKGALRSKHLHREILNPQRNLTCAMSIMQKLLTSSDKPLPQVFAPYWSTVDAKHPKKYSRFLTKLKEAGTVCDLPVPPAPTPTPAPALTQ